jgi:hypothetical protein
MTKSILIAFLVTGSVAFAAGGLTPERFAELAHVSSTFKIDCLKKPAIVQIKSINVTNKTSESFEKSAVSDSLMKELGLTINENSQNVINVRVDSKIKETKKERSSEYKYTLTLADDTADICKHSYGKTYTELK